jgi:hypothetical protein
MKCLILNTGVVGLLTAALIRKQYGQNVSIQVVDTYSPEEQSIIRLGPETLNFIVRDLGFSLAHLMTGKNPGIFYLGQQIKPDATAETTIIAQEPTRAQIGAMPVNYALDRIKRVGGMEKLEQYSLAARMIKANVMALPNKKGECPLGDDEIGISISLNHLRELLISRLSQNDVSVECRGTIQLNSEGEYVRALFSDGSIEVFNCVISTDANFELFKQVQWQQSIEFKSQSNLAYPCASIAFDSIGWQIKQSVVSQERSEFCCIGWSKHGEDSMKASTEFGKTQNKTSAWFGANWDNRIIYLSEYNFWGAEFLLDPMQPVVRAIQLLINLFPVSAGSQLSGRYFNERVKEISTACREYIIAFLLESGVPHTAEIISQNDIAAYEARKQIYMSTGQPVQAAANLIGEGVWAAFWHAFSVYPQNASSLLQSLDLEEIVRQLADIDANIAEIIPRLPSHNYYISLINGGSV